VGQNSMFERAAQPTAEASAPNLAAALDTLRRGDLVAIPTETVYGLAADAHNPSAIEAVFALKGRPSDHPLIIHLGDLSWLDRYADPVSAEALELAQAHWPGPLTLVVPASKNVDRRVTGGASTVALRMPGHPMAQALLRQFGRGLVAPSANRYGSISPTSAADVRAEFGDQTPLVLDGGACEKGIESTIVDCTVTPPRLLRPGSLRLPELDAPLADHLGPRAPGRVERHYAPTTPAYRVPQQQWEETLREPPDDDFQALSWRPLPAGVRGISLPADADDYARALYASLRQLDQTGARCILVQQVPDGAEWKAVADRLSRATVVFAD